MRRSRQSGAKWMRATGFKTRPGLSRLAFGVVTASALLVTFAPQAQAATAPIASIQKVATANWCENAGHFTQDLAVNSKSQEVSGSKSLIHLSANAPNSALKSNLKTLGKRISAAAASYPHPPSDASVAKDQKLESKLESEISSACATAGGGGGSGSSSTSTVSLACPSAAQVGATLGVAITAVKVASSPCDYTGPAANPLITVDYGSGAPSKAAFDKLAHSQNMTAVSGVGVDAYRGVNGGTTTIEVIDSHGNQVVVDVARNASQGPGAGDATGAEALAKAVLAG
jgi:hypothetical protein